MKKQYCTSLFFSVLLFGLLFFFCSAAHADYDRFLSSPNPVGSGARALGMGGAFIGIADDATAASWNPGGLVQLKKPEISIVGSFVWKNDNYDANYNTETTQRTLDSQELFGNEINYLSIVYPFSFFRRNMVISLNYQKLYDYSLKQSVVSEDIGAGIVFNTNIDRDRTGILAPFGFAYSIQVIPQLSVGITCNFWQPHNNVNKIIDRYNTSATMDGQSPVYDLMKVSAEFEGFNYNVGFLWSLFDSLSVGVVYKSHFNADIENTIYQRSIYMGIPEPPKSIQLNEKLQMPESYGIGFCYKVNDNLKLSADIYYTSWDDYIYTNEDGEQYSPITGDLENESDVDATVQARTGLEYLLVNPIRQLSFPLRFGMLIDPIPDREAPIMVYGVSYGAGIARGNWAIDAFYQYKFSEDIDTIEERPDLLPKTISEHAVFLSMIYYL